MSFVEILYIVLSYCIGAIPFGLLVSRGSGINIREQGSKNIGATNVTRLLGKKMGVIALCGDVLKGFLPIFIATLLMEGKANAHLVVALCGAATVVGHMFPIYLGFKGGKGVATALGVFLFLSPIAILGCLLIFVAAVYFSGFVSLGSLLGSAAIVGLLLLLGASTWKILLAGFIVVLIWGKHYQNIGRLLSGAEKSWKKKSE
ncbi:glycerol-3-phosphate 1-O-acyltransferase PlsY [Desulfogranum marinum]|uniref:glycerol-3-phosphate 1-O-acyltransferase PlsY n=1 Tax=Desulfogranum marinum TaxID=453220 RepID=UPI001963789D|nr:glycerol-3-phosphate 1-O-acyltransferase PlsY [Desulfogranum marinum]MBM9514434.1 glycerol-3-phosphate 1-O-acyltransferase PlsY [Desulfogranum marinum]